MRVCVDVHVCLCVCLCVYVCFIGVSHLLHKSNWRKKDMPNFYLSRIYLTHSTSCQYLEVDLQQTLHQSEISTSLVHSFMNYAVMPVAHLSQA